MALTPICVRQKPPVQSELNNLVGINQLFNHRGALYFIFRQKAIYIRAIDLLNTRKAIPSNIGGLMEVPLAT